MAMPSPKLHPEMTESQSAAASHDPQAELTKLDMGRSPIDDSIDPENEVTGSKLFIIHTGICLCTFLVGLDFNVLATAVPVITSKFDSIEAIGWYGAAFYMALCASQPLAGKTYTLFPKALVYLAYLGLFEAGSLICGLANSSNMLIGGRVIAGLGASGIFAGGFAILASIIPLHKRAIFIGTMSSTYAIANVVGPLLGGGLTQHVSWRWCFYINLPIGGLVALIAIVFFRFKAAPTEAITLAEKLKGLDFLGFVLFSASVVMLLLALQWGGSAYSWESSVVIGLFVGFGLLMILFVSWQRYLQDNALIPTKLFDNRNVWLICASSFFVNGPFQTIIYWLPIWFQAVQGASPTASGIRYLPTVISDILAAVVGSAVVMKLGAWNPFLLFAEVMVCLGAGLLTTLYPTASAGHWIGYQIFGGVGFSLAGNLAHLGMQASLPKELVPIGATNLLMIISTSCSIFLAIGQAVFHGRLESNLTNAIPSNPRLVDELVSGGVGSIRSCVNVQDLPIVIKAYSDSATEVWYIPAAAPVLSFVLVAACKWTSVKKPKTVEGEEVRGEEGKGV